MSKSKVKCLHCQKISREGIGSLLNGSYCMRCVLSRGIGGSHLRGARRCMIPGCLNHTDEGDFVGDLCAPCHSYLVLNKGVHSQAYRNERSKATWREISQFLSRNPNVKIERSDDGRMAVCLMFATFFR